MVSPTIDISCLSKHPFSIDFSYGDNLMYLITKMREAVSNLFQHFCDSFSKNSEEIELEVLEVAEVPLLENPIFWERLDARIHNLHERRRLKLEAQGLENRSIPMVKSPNNAPP